MGNEPESNKPVLDRKDVLTAIDFEISHKETALARHGFSMCGGYWSNLCFGLGCHKSDVERNAQLDKCAFGSVRRAICPPILSRAVDEGSWIMELEG